MIRPAFLISILILLNPLSAETRWYRSNPAAMELEQLEEGAQADWLLEIANQEDLEIRRLFHEGREDQRWEILHLEESLFRETFYRGNSLISVVETNNAGDLLLEEYYLSGELSLSREYEYPGENLVIRRVWERGAQESYLERLRYRSDGGLLSLYRSQGEMHQNWIDLDAESNQAQWLLREGEGMMTLFNPQGNPYRILEMADNIILKEERREYDGLGRLLSAEIDIPQAGEFLKQRYDSQERLVEEQLFRNNVLVSQTNFTYTGGLLVEKKLTGQGIPQRWEYIYQDNRLMRTDYYLGEYLYEQTYTHGQTTPQGGEE